MNIVKMSEKIMEKLAESMSKEVNGIFQYQRRIKIPQTVIVDYSIEKNGKIIALLEFDGPTHFTKPRTQLRDYNLRNFCDDNNIALVRIPYFIQVDDRTLSIIFEEECIEDIFPNTIKGFITEYKNGFWDKACILPGEFNSMGINIFESWFTKFVYRYPSVCKEIRESLEQFDKRHVHGIDYPKSLDFLNHEI